MEANAQRAIERLLASSRPADLHQGLELVRKEISTVGSDDARPLFEMVSTIFYIDPLDRPDLAPLVNEAIALVVGFGKWVIPSLLQQLEAGDLKAQMAIANALGRMGADAIVPLMAEYRFSPDAERRQFALYALGKIKSPKIVQALDCALEAVASEARELRDTAMRTIGKFAESIAPGQFPDDTRQRLVQVLQGGIADDNPSIRAKAIRSTGKLAKYGHLTAPDKDKLRETLSRILGKDERFEWDRAYLVRKEAAEALTYL